MKFPLQHPIALGKSTFSELTFRDHTTAADYLALDQIGTNRRYIALVASLTGTDEALIERLHGVDFQRAQAEVEKLLGADNAEFKRLTGATDATSAEEQASKNAS